MAKTYAAGLTHLGLRGGKATCGLSFDAIGKTKTKNGQAGCLPSVFPWAETIYLYIL